MNKALIITLASLVVSGTALAQSNAFKGVSAASQDMAQIYIDIGKKCGVDAKDQDNTWFAHFSNVVNKERTEAAIGARLDKNSEAYDRAIRSISCPN
tara:strand:- start:4427 stop:4717 length:291 start_codon:yes stop_codon:yes gene_type:complete